MSSLVQTTPPADDAIDLQSLIEWSRLSDSAEDDEANLSDILACATASVENRLGQSLMKQAWRLTLDRWPCNGILRLPRGPLWLDDDDDDPEIAIVYTDTAGVARTLAASAYLVDSDSVPPRIMPVYGTVWPVLRVQMNAVQVTYSTGRDDADELPATSRTAIRMMFAHLYENREPVVTGIVQQLPNHIEQLLADETIPHFDPDF